MVRFSLMKRGAAAALVLLVAFGAACSLVLSTSGEQQCTTNGDCARFSDQAICVNNVCVAQDGSTADVSDSGADVDPIWGCLGNVVVAPVKKPMAKVSVQFIDAVTLMPVTDLSVCVCPKLDLSCATPIAGPIAPSVMDGGGGVVTATVPTGSAGFDGFYLITPRNDPDAAAPTCPPAAMPDAGPDAGGNAFAIIPSMVFFNPPVVDDTKYNTILLVSQLSLGLIAMQANETIDPALGEVFFQATDCQGKGGAGVSCTIDHTMLGETKSFYLIGGQPLKNASATDISGYGGFINVPTGFSLVTGALQMGNKTIGHTTVGVRTGYISYLTLAPSPP